MNVYAEVEHEKDLLAKILTVAERKESLGFADLFRGGDSVPDYIERIKPLQRTRSTSLADSSTAVRPRGSVLPLGTPTNAAAHERLRG